MKLQLCVGVKIYLFSLSHRLSRLHSAKKDSAA